MNVWNVLSVSVAMVRRRVPLVHRGVARSRANASIVRAVACRTVLWPVSPAHAAALRRTPLNASIVHWVDINPKPDNWIVTIV